MDHKISMDRIDEMLRAVFEELKSMGSRASANNLLAAVEPKLDLSDYEKGSTATGGTRWDLHIRYFATDCVGAGFLVAKGDGWALTSKGEKALKLPPGELVRTAEREAALLKDRPADRGSSGGDEPQDEAEPPAEYDLLREAAWAEIRDGLFGCSWNRVLQWDFEFPDLDLDAWHISPGFIDPVANELEKWSHECDHKIEDYQKLARFTDHLGHTDEDYQKLKHFTTYWETSVSCTHSAAWNRAKAWLEVHQLSEFRATFERRVKAISEEARDFLIYLARLHWEGDPVIVDGDTESSCGIASFGMTVDGTHLQYLRDTSQFLRQKTAKGGGGIAVSSGDEDVGGQIADLQTQVKELKEHVRRPKSKREQINEQRVKFCRPYVDKGESWSAIHMAYYQKHPEDRKANKDSLRLTWKRHSGQY